MFRPGSSRVEAADIALLDEVERALTTGEATRTSRLCLALAHSIPQAEEAYRAALRARLVATGPDVHRRAHQDEWLRAFLGNLVTLPKRRLLIAATVALFVVPISAAVAECCVIPKVIPWIVTEPITGLITRRVPLTNVASDVELQRLLSFPLWVPTVVPCDGPNQRAYDPAQQRASLVYQCLAITEVSADNVVRPVADAGTVEEVSVNGQPALYYESTVVMPGSGTTKTGRSVILSLGGTTITLTMLPEHTRNGVRELEKADLIRIAGTLSRVRAP
jgi:hypothetical protein